MTFKEENGFSLVEVIVAAAVFTVTVAGVLSTVNALNQPAEEGVQEITASFLGKQILEELRTKVDAADWNDPSSSALHPLGGGGSGLYQPGDITIGNIVYTPEYQVTDDAATGGRFVKIRVSW